MTDQTITAAPAAAAPAAAAQEHVVRKASAAAASKAASGKAASKAAEGGSFTPKQTAAAAAAQWLPSPARTGSIKVAPGAAQHYAAFTGLARPGVTVTVSSTPHYRAARGKHAAACAAFTAWHAATPGAARTMEALLAHKPFTAAGGNVAFVQWRAAQGMLALV